MCPSPQNHTAGPDSAFSPKNVPARRTTVTRFKAATTPFLAARPLIYGLDDARQMELVRVDPAQMKRMLIGGELDAALLPTSDLPSFGPHVTILPAGCVAATGPTLLAKIFSQVKPEDLSVIWADRRSHSTLTLVQVLWTYLYKQKISIIPFDGSRGHPPADAEAVLLIGDTVVSDPPIGYDYQLDPAAMWYEMTGLPFVFAVWATIREYQLRQLYRLLSGARKKGMAHLDDIAAKYGPAYGWPADLANKCLHEYMQFEFTEEHREGLEEFLDLAAECGLIEQTPALHYYVP